MSGSRARSLLGTRESGLVGQVKTVWRPLAAEAGLEFFCIEMGVSLEKDSSRSQSQEGLCMLGVSIDVVWFTMIVILSGLCVPLKISTVWSFQRLYLTLFL